MNTRDLGVVLALGVLAVVLLALLGTGSLPAWSQSPTSPLPTEDTPRVQVPVFPGIGASPVSPGGRPPSFEQPARLLDAELWSSPWSWVVVGIIAFGGVAWVLTALFRRLESRA